MIINFDKHDLFSLPIYKVKIDPNSYDKESFLETVKTNYEIDPTRCNHFPENDEFGNLHHSYADTENEKLGLEGSFNSIFLFSVLRSPNTKFIFLFSFKNFSNF